MDTITPAYGRDYTSLKDALADWNAGKDFLLNTSTRGIPCNIQDADRVSQPLRMAEMGGV